MSSKDMSPKEKWNQIYNKDTQPGSPAAVLSQHAALLPESGRALDIACGTGSNTLFLARHGLQVDAWDISDVAITALHDKAGDLPVSAQCVDISAFAFNTSSYDVIVNCHYLDREIIPAIRDALRPGGLLFFQTFTRDKVISIGPSSPEFLLASGELLGFAEGLEVLHYQDESHNQDTDDPLAGRACLIAKK